MKSERIPLAPGILATDHTLEVPLRHAEPDGPAIQVFARELVVTKKAEDDLPWLVYLQGGPGFEAPRPEAKGGWIEAALERFRLLLLDQRGTGRSTPATAQTLAHLESPAAQADYLACFRADSIVRDCELIRRQLLGPDEKWTIFGQSFGGFCALTYLSFAPEGLAGALITGGLSSLDRGADEVYRATTRIVMERNRRYYERFPQDVEHVHRIVRILERGNTRLPSGDVLTPRRFEQLGMVLGRAHGATALHYLLEDAFADDDTLSTKFLIAVEARLSFCTNPIYALLHEAIYCQGEASRWSAERVRAEHADELQATGAPFHFTGEMVYPWVFDDVGSLSPLKEAAHLLAEREGWPALYDPAVLTRNEVPTAALVYADDMYVPRQFSEETASRVRGLHLWLTNEFQHDGIRGAGKNILERLLRLIDGEEEIPS